MGKNLNFPFDIFSVNKYKESNGLEMMSLENVVASLEQMAKPPSMDDLIGILQQCRKNKDAGHAKRVYSYICKNELEAHRVLGNFVVPMLAECGNMIDAKELFQRLTDRNEYSWTALVQGYIGCGELQHAFNLFESMQRDCVLPNRYTLQALLKACARLNCIKRGWEIHFEIVKQGFEQDPFVGSTLVDMYGKCGSLLEAQEVFDKMPVRHPGAWTALITGYTEHGLGDEALKFLNTMQLQGISPDAVTFVCILKACSNMRAISEGQEIHAKVAIEGFEKEITVGSIMVDMYAKCGFLSDAQEVFDELPVRNVVSWNTLIAGYVEHGLGEEALKCMEHMQLQGVSPNSVTFLGSLKACGSIKLIDRCRELYVEIVKNGFETDASIGTTLVATFAKSGSLAEAHELLNKLPVRTVFSWTAIIAGHVEHGLGEEALRCLREMQLEGVPPNAVTYISSLKACSMSRTMNPGQELHIQIVKEGIERDSSVGNTLVDMYTKCGSPTEARKVFDELPIRDVVSWNALITGYAELGLSEQALNCMEEMQLDGLCEDAVTFVSSLKACGSIGATEKGLEIHAKIAEEGLENDSILGGSLVDMYAKCGALVEAQEVFDELLLRDVFSWTALIAGYAERGFDEEALNLVQKMQMEGTALDNVICMASLKACGNIGAIDRGRGLHVEIVKEGFERDPYVGSTLVDMYAKCGSLTEAEDVFDEMPVHNVVGWTALLAGHAYQAESDLVFCLFKRMREEGLQPDEVTALSVLTACCHGGLVDKGYKYLKAISKEYGITLKLEHYNCIVDLLGRAGQVNEAMAMLEKMPFQPNLVTWSTLLSACQKWSDAELGMQAFECAMRFGKNQAASFILISKIFADAYTEKDLKRIEENIRESQAWNELGKSWTG